MELNFTKSAKQFSLILFFLLGFNFQIKAQVCNVIGDSIVCENEVVAYATSNTGIGFTYQWNALGGVVVGVGSSINVTWANPGSGQVNLVVRNALNQIICTATKLITIYASPKPFILPSFVALCGAQDSIGKGGGSAGKDRKRDECLSVCDSTWVTYSVINHPGSTYSWQVLGSATVIPSVTNSIQVKWTGVGSGSIKVTETSVYGCLGIDELCVVVVAKPNASFTSLPAAVGGIINACLNQTIQFINTSNAGGGSPLWTHTWVWGDGNTTVLSGAGSGNASHQYAAAGSYNVMLIVENECHCKDTAFVKVVVDNKPGPDIQCVSTVCPGTTVTYNTNAVCPNYLWTVINGTIIGSATNQTVTVSWGASGPGYLTLQTIGCSGTCTAPTTVVVPIIPSVATISGKPLVCEFECEEYRISCTIPIDSIKWTVPAGVTIITDSINVNVIKVCFYNPLFTSGNITATYYHSTPGAVPPLSCGGVATLTVTKRPKLSLFYPSEICDLTSLGGSHNTTATGNIQWQIFQSGNPIAVATSIQSASFFYNPFWVWGPGTFTITATDLSGNYCNSPQSFVLKVNPIPPSPSAITGETQVCPNSPYQYLGFATSSNLSLMWNITGGTPSTASGPFVSILWGPSTPYTISLTQLDPKTGCQSTPITYNVNSNLPLSPSVITGATTACNNSNTSNFYSTSSPGTNFVWSISPAIAGSVMSGNNTPNISVQWNNWTGLATITLVRTVCGTSISTNYTVNVIAPPALNISVPTSVCQGSSATMSSSTPGATFAWNFGDGGTGSGSPVSHIYNTAGTYIVTLTATYTGTCTGSAVSFATIVVNPRPNVSISTPDPNIFCGTVSNVNMYVASPAISTTYQWFRAPSTSVGTGTSHTSNILGSYYVVATNSFGCQGTSNSILIDTNCVNCIPDPNYSVNFNIIKQGCNKDSFAGTFTSGASSPSYNFDDPYGSPNIVSATNASHVFPEPGYYRVKFCVNVPNTTNTDSCRICKIKVDTIKYIANFIPSLSCISGSGSVQVNLLNTTKILSGFPTPSYAWSYNGNPTFSTFANPTILLPSGTYSFTLVVNGNCVRTISVVIPALPVANFTRPDSVCVNAPVLFTNTSTGVFVNSQWTFSDGASSLINSPTKTFASSGLISVKLRITNSFGCRDSITKTIRVLPNTLNVSISATGPTSFCEGDSVTLVRTILNGYPSYSTLWSTTQTTPSIRAKYTGQYYVDVTDSKGCFARSNVINVLVHPKPRPNITGPISVCSGKNPDFSVNYPSTPYTIAWQVNGNFWSNQSNITLWNPPVGNHVVTVQVISPDGCIGYDTMLFTVHPLPNVFVGPAANLCEGVVHTLTGGSTSTNIIAQYWNTGANTNSINVSNPGVFVYTVVDSNACRNSASKTIHPLPDFCGFVSGCYEICDTVKKLVWYAPKGYAAYQWYYNGNPLPWATNDTIHIPLYKAGTYTVMLTSIHGCSKMSPDVNIKFINCGNCISNINVKINCGPVNSLGYQTYSVSMQITNNLSAGAGISISSPQGTITGLSPGTLALGINTVTFTFTDIPPIDIGICFTVTIFNEIKKCDTTICLELPPCETNCEKSVKIKSIECAGYDVSGNPMYYVCADVFWGGSNGSQLTINNVSGSFMPNPITINNGTQTLCFTYTDLPPTSSFTTFYFSFFDSISNKICRDSVRVQYKPCAKECKFGIYGICVHCKEITTSGPLYNIELTINNTVGSGASVSILPISGGVFGTPNPATVPSGISTINVPFTDIGVRDSIICFRVLLTLNGSSCWQDVCVYLPICDDHNSNINITELNYFSVSPNPTNEIAQIQFNAVNSDNNYIEVKDLNGKEIYTQKLDQSSTELQLMVSDWAPGVYFVSMKNNGVFRGSIKLIVQ